MSAYSEECKKTCKQCANGNHVVDHPIYGPRHIITERDSWDASLHVSCTAPTLGQFAEGQAVRVKELEDAIRKHDQKGDDRCWLDDLELYAVLNGEIQPDNSMPPREKFLENGDWPSYQELRAHILDLEKRLSNYSKACAINGAGRCHMEVYD